MGVNGLEWVHMGTDGPNGSEWVRANGHGWVSMGLDGRDGPEWA